MITIRLYNQSRVNSNNKNKFRTKEELEQSLGTPSLTSVLAQFDYNDGVIARVTLDLGAIDPPTLNYSKITTIVGTSDFEQYYYIVGYQYKGQNVYTLHLVIDAWHSLGGVGSVLSAFGTQLPCVRAPQPLISTASYDLTMPETIQQVYTRGNNVVNWSYLVPDKPTTPNLTGTWGKRQGYMVWVVLDSLQDITFQNGANPQRYFYFDELNAGVNPGLFWLGFPCTYDNGFCDQMMTANNLSIANQKMLLFLTQSVISNKIQNIIVDPIMCYGECYQNTSTQVTTFNPCDYNDVAQINISQGNVFYVVMPHKLTKSNNLANAGIDNILTGSINYNENIVTQIAGNKQKWDANLYKGTITGGTSVHTLYNNKVTYDYRIDYRLSDTTTYTQLYTAEWQISLPWATSALSEYLRANKNAYEQSVAMPQAGIDQQLKWQRINSAGNAISQGVSLIGDIAQGNVGGVVNGVMGLAKTGMQALENEDNADFQKSQLEKSFLLSMDNLRNARPIIHQADGIHMIDSSMATMIIKETWDTSIYTPMVNYYNKYGYNNLGNFKGLADLLTEDGFYQFKNVSDYIDIGYTSTVIYNLLVLELERGIRIIT